MLVVYFNKAFKVERIANYGLKDGVIFDFISRTTATGGEEQSFVRNLFRGVTQVQSFRGLSGSRPRRSITNPQRRLRVFCCRPHRPDLPSLRRIARAAC